MAYTSLTDLMESWRAGPEHNRRLEVRRASETRARELLTANLGNMTAEQIEEFCDAVNSDFSGGRIVRGRFKPAFVGNNRTVLAENADAFNKWTRRLWEAEDPITTLSEFWEAGELPRAGKSLPSVVLYLRDRERYLPWVGILHEAVADLTEAELGAGRTGPAYSAYNEQAQRLRQQHAFAPEEADLFLADWALTKRREAKAGTAGPKPGADDGFAGFPEDAFKFLEELGANNNKEWMGGNLERYRSALRDPLRALARKIATEVVTPELNPGNPDPFETRIDRSHCVSIIQRNAFGRGDPYHTHMWFAFYRQSREKKFKDAQLFFIIYPEAIKFGFYVGEYARDLLDAFQRRVTANPDTVWRLLTRASVRENCKFLYAAPGSTECDTIWRVADSGGLTKWVMHDRIGVERPIAKEDPLATSQELADAVAETFRAVYPLFLIATREDWAEAAAAWLGEEPPDVGPEPLPAYTESNFLDETLLEKKVLDSYRALLARKPQLVFYGVPGTGKTFIALRLAKLLAGGDTDRVKLVQFHPSYAYEDFIEGIRPRTIKSGNRTDIDYRLQDGVFKTLCQQAAQSKDQSFVLVIDEINRGNVSRIFGELMYLLEYRGEPMDLPYSDQPLTIPRNLYVIGTMNSADRSIALVDYALRRRFHFVELLPSADVLQAWHEENGVECPEAVAAFELLNQQLREDGIDRHFLIGHSHFMLKDMDVATLASVWRHSVMPLIDEYLFNQPERLTRYEFETIMERVNQQLQLDEPES